MAFIPKTSIRAGLAALALTAPALAGVLTQLIEGTGV